MSDSSNDRTRPAWFAEARFASTLILALAILQIAMRPALSAPTAAPVRVLVPPAPFRPPPETLQSPTARAGICLSRHLYAWLERVPQVRLLDGAQAEALLAAATGPAWSHPAGSELATLAAFVPLDAVVLWEAEGDAMVCRLQRPAGERRVSVAYPGPQALPALLQAVTALVAQELALDPATSPLAADWPLDNPKLIEDCMVARSLWGGFMVNAGTVRLELLRPHLDAMPSYPAVAAAVINGARWFTFDGLPVENAGRYTPLAKMALACLLGTDREAEALDFCRHTAYGRPEIEAFLLDIVRDAGRDEIDALLDAPEADGGGTLGVGGQPAPSGVAAVLASKRTPAQQAGAIRCLGAMASAPALAHLERLAGGGEAVLREAVATALGGYRGNDGLETLGRLAQDATPPVAFAAALSLQSRDQASPNFAGQARRILAAEPGDEAALGALAELGEAGDAALLAAQADSAQSARRRQAARGLLRLGQAPEPQVAAWLADTSADVVQAVLAALPAAAAPAHAAALRRLANHPLNAVADLARAALAPLAPADPGARARFDLDVEHAYVRRRIVEDWARATSPTAGDGLAAACANALPDIRALALIRLSEAAPERLPTVLENGLRDPHREARLSAAAVAAKHAGTAHAAALQTALAAETDPVIRLYLEEALARAEQRALPVPPPAVHRVSVETNQTFLCGLPSADAPYDGFYGLNVDGGAATRARLKSAHEAGKIFLPRANRTATSPAQVFFDPRWRDGFWLGVEEEFQDILPWIDGVVLGEESMGWRPGDLWAGGWRLFCREAGLDPAQVDGRWEALSPARRIAFRDWEQRVQIEAFNAMVERLKLRFGKVRPGFQIATFLPHQNGPCAYDLDWRFDIAAGYDYAEGNSRRRYGIVRRFKTLWPERPVIWLSQGRAGVGLSLNDTVVRHTTPVPASPWHAPNEVTAVDALTAWQAGAHSGLFAIYLFVRHSDRNPTTGVWVGLGDLAPGNPEFERGIARMFEGLAEAYETKAGIAAARPDMSLAEKADDPVVESLLEGARGKAANPHAARAAAEQEAFRRGFLLEGRLVQDAVNALAGLPFPRQSRTVLLVGPDSLSTPGFDLATDFDCLRDIDTLARLPLDGYRFIGLAGQESAALRNATAAAVLRWLETQPGLLYVRGWVSDDSARFAFRAGDPEDARWRGWPWTGEVSPTPSAANATGYAVTGGNATALGETPAGAGTLVFWRRPGWRGGILFDAGAHSAAALAPILRRLQADQSLGVAFDGVGGIQRSELPGLVAVTSSTRAAAPIRVSGMDLLTGIRNPDVPPGRSGVFAPRQVRGVYLAVANGIAVLSERPIEAVEPVAGGLRIRSSGLIRAVSEGGAVRVTRLDGGPLPSVPDEAMLDWLFDPKAPGAYSKREDGTRVTLARAPGGVTLTMENKP